VSGAFWMYLILDSQANGALPAVTDIFTSVNLEVANINIENSKRFRIIRKWCVDLNPQAGVSAGYNNISKCFDTFLKVNTVIDFDKDTTTGAIADIKSKNYIMVYGLTDITVSGGTSIDGTCRIRFDDM